MFILYSDHALKRLRQRGIPQWQVEDVLTYPISVKNSYDGRKEAIGVIDSREIHIVFIRTENYIKIITII